MNRSWREDTSWNTADDVNNLLNEEAKSRFIKVAGKELSNASQLLATRKGIAYEKLHAFLNEIVASAASAADSTLESYVPKLQRLCSQGLETATDLLLAESGKGSESQVSVPTLPYFQGAS